MNTLMQINWSGDYAWLIVLGVVVFAIIALLAFRNRRTTTVDRRPLP